MALLTRIFGRHQSPEAAERPARRVVVTASTLAEAAEGLRASGVKGHEGIVYFTGIVGRDTTLAISAVAPAVTATRGSVDVGYDGMATVVRAAARDGLQVVGQLHTHPTTAFHSDGDLRGMRIRYDGYFSIVAPGYGRDLPSLADADALMWSGGRFVAPSGLHVLGSL